MISAELENVHTIDSVENCYIYIKKIKLIIHPLKNSYRLYSSLLEKKY